jgi:hypothetical protein
MARVREDGQPDSDQSGVIIDGVFEEIAASIGGGHDVRYKVKGPGGFFVSREIEVRKIPLDRTMDPRRPERRCRSGDIAPSAVA